MTGKKYAAEQIVAKLGEAEVLLGKGMALGEVCRQLEITDVTYYRWKLGEGLRGVRLQSPRHQARSHSSCPTSNEHTP